MCEGERGKWSITRDQQPSEQKREGLVRSGTKRLFRLLLSRCHITRSAIVILCGTWRCDSRTLLLGRRARPMDESRFGGRLHACHLDNPHRDTTVAKTECGGSWPRRFATFSLDL
jgi:hypothetical protein